MEHEHEAIHYWVVKVLQYSKRQRMIVKNI